MAFVLSLFVPNLVFRCLRKAVLRDSGTYFFTYCVVISAISLNS